MTNRTDDDDKLEQSERRATLRRKRDRELFDLATAAHSLANKAIESIDRHTVECAKNYQDMRYIGKWVIGVLASAAVLLLTGIGAVAWGLFQFILSNKHLLTP